MSHAGIEKTAVSADIHADVLESMRQPAAQMQFTFIDNQEELRRVIEGGDFSTNLADSLRDNLLDLEPSLPMAHTLGQPGIYVAGVDALASAVLRSAPKAVDEAMRLVLGEVRTSPALRAPASRWREVLETTDTTLPPSLANETFLATEYALVVVPSRVHDEASYLRVRRPGRGVALDRAKRSAVWKLIATYRARN